MDEENFKKKSSNKTLRIVLLVVLLLAIAGVVAFLAINKVNSKPEKVFDKAIEQMFEGSDKVQEYKTMKIDLELSAGVKTAGTSSMDVQTEMISSILKSAKLSANIAYDFENQVMDTEFSAKYEGKDVISFETILQDGKAYAYLKDLYSKYIEIPMEELEADLDFDTILKTAETSTKLAKDVEEILKAKIEDSEFETEETEIEIAGKDKKVNKSTLRLTVKEVSEIAYDILSKVNEYQTEREVKEMLEEALEELKYVDDERENYVDISIYTEKTGNNIVKVDITMVNKEDDEVILMAATKIEDKKWEIVFAMNEYSTSVKDAKEMFKIEITEENENEGRVSIIAEVEGMEITLNIDYKVEYNVNVGKKNITNTIKAEDMTEDDLQEILENAEKNEILKAIIDMAMETYNNNTLIPSYSF